MKTLNNTIKCLLMALALVSTQLAAQTEGEAADEVIESIVKDTVEAKAENPDLALWEKTKARPTIVNLGKYLEEFPNGEFASEARERVGRLEAKARKQAVEDKALEAYRKNKLANGLVLELGGRFEELKPYVRSMLNSCGYQTVAKDRFAKKVYPTISIDGSLFNGRSDLEHSVTLNLSVVLKTKNRQIKARERMLSYRTSEASAHKALQAAFEDIGAQMKSGGFCI